ncbi:hypothetical protein MHEL_57690 [Mycolicibacterium helvum]|uniref:Uncharacterized protein n=1 Tax=Mycolicibacterium helvum TaxID=1534349 RepID=A0A7I7TH89_9MYCO|nr:hypothetical protein MHEL_57690 [Mycolicibacterium helvum]
MLGDGNADHQRRNAERDEPQGADPPPADPDGRDLGGFVGDTARPFAEADPFGGTIRRILVVGIHARHPSVSSA